MKIKTIEVIVAPDGRTKLETKGLAGSQCRDASKLLEAALGKTTEERLTAEYHQTTTELSAHTHSNQVDAAGANHQGEHFMEVEYESPPPTKFDKQRNILRLRSGPTRCPIGLAGMLIVVEGVNDTQFLRRISAMLHEHDPSLPDLAAREDNGQLVFLPIGGGSIDIWSERLAPIRCAEFHLYDREMPPETELRQKVIRRIQSRSGCNAALTRMRSLENYLHPDAILGAGGPRIEFGEDDLVPELVAKSELNARHPHVPWNSVSRRTQKRLSNLAKRLLNTDAVDFMTPQLLRESDPHGDILSWLATIDAFTGWQS